MTTNDTFHFTERDGKWYLDIAALKSGAPDMIREKKSSPPRQMRPQEETAMREMRDAARQWEAFSDQKAAAITLAHSPATATRLRMRRLRVVQSLLDGDEGT